MSANDLNHYVGIAEMTVWQLVLFFYALRDFVRKNR